jgi:hypothetical protein
MALGAERCLKGEIGCNLGLYRRDTRISISHGKSFDAKRTFDVARSGEGISGTLRFNPLGAGSALMGTDIQIIAVAIPTRRREIALVRFVTAGLGTGLIGLLDTTTDLH